MPVLDTLTQEFRRARVTNATDNGFPSRLITAARPSGVGDNAAQATASAVFDLGGGEFATGQNRAFVKPFGAGANNATFSMRLIGWNRVYGRTGNDPNTSVWDPTVLGEFACTLSSTPIGLAGKILIATDLFADTITVTGTTANQGVSVDVVSPANDTPAHLIIDIKGLQLLELTFTTGGSATSCNALVKFF